MRKLIATGVALAGVGLALIVGFTPAQATQNGLDGPGNCGNNDGKDGHFKSHDFGFGVFTNLVHADVNGGTLSYPPGVDGEIGTFTAKDGAVLTVTFGGPEADNTCSVAVPTPTPTPTSTPTPSPTDTPTPTPTPVTTTTTTTTDQSSSGDSSVAVTLPDVGGTGNPPTPFTGADVPFVAGGSLFGTGLALLMGAMIRNRRNS